MGGVLLLQRVVPSYRVPVFERLAQSPDWTIVCAGNLPDSNLRLAKDLPFVRRVPFGTGTIGGKKVYRVPVGSLMRRFEPQAVLAEGALGMSSTWELAARRLLGGPKLGFWTIGYEATSLHRSGGSLASQSHRLAAYAGADALLLYGEDGKDLMRSVFPRKPLFVARNTLDIEAIRKHRVDTGPERHVGPRLISVGRLTPNKNFPMLVEAFLHVLARFPDAKLTILGEGPERGKIENAAGNQLDRSVFLRGESYDEAATARHMCAAELFVCAGRLGLAINHALAYGLPVVAFENSRAGPYHGSEFNYLVEGVTGFRVAPFTSEALGAKIIEVLSSGIDWKWAMSASIDDFTANRISLDNMLVGFREIADFLLGRTCRSN